MATDRYLRQQLLHLDRQSYKAYKKIQGSYEFPEFQLLIEHVQADPFAAPSKVRLRISHAIANFPPNLYSSPSREVALRDYLGRQFGRFAQTLSDRRGSGNSGRVVMARLGQEVLERTAVLIEPQWIEVRFGVGLPGLGRSIAGKQAADLLCDRLPELVDRTLKYAALDGAAIQRQVETVEDADWLRQHLGDRGLVAFVPEGAILPRRSGADDRPLQQEVMPFQAPDSLRVEFCCPNRGAIAGMGIPAGVTLIVGGGYHGKSTVLKAIERGVYNHVPGDGRELVVTNSAAVKIRAEDGRGIASADISPFINHLPQGRSTVQFSTENASGSTSQAANIVEALEVGARLLLMDEDTSATNFTIRDRRMQALIAKEKEPITPFIDKVRQLYTDCDVSTILVMGGSGDYFDVADTVIAMTDFQPQEVTAEARAIAQQYATDRAPEGGEQFGSIARRVPLLESLDPSRGRKPVRLKVRDVNAIVFGDDTIDLSAVEQLVDEAQLQAIAAAMVYAKEEYLDGRQELSVVCDRILADIQDGGLDILTPFPQGNLACFRRFELAAAINRLRTLKIA